MKLNSLNLKNGNSKVPNTKLHGLKPNAYCIALRNFPKMGNS